MIYKISYNDGTPPKTATNRKDARMHVRLRLGRLHRGATFVGDPSEDGPLQTITEFWYDRKSAKMEQHCAAPVCVSVTRELKPGKAVA